MTPERIAELRRVVEYMEDGSHADMLEELLDALDEAETGHDASVDDATRELRLAAQEADERCVRLEIEALRLVAGMVDMVAREAEQRAIADLERARLEALRRMLSGDFGRRCEVCRYDLRIGGAHDETCPLSPEWRPAR